LVNIDFDESSNKNIPISWLLPGSGKLINKKKYIEIYNTLFAIYGEIAQ
jgi:hypothetical protein